MKWLTFEVQRTPGFRFNLIDLLFILGLCATAAGTYFFLPDDSLWLIPIYLGISFFLFCNVFRIGNRLESIWYVPFTLAAIYGVCAQDLRSFWIAVACVLEPLKWVLIAYRIKKGQYVGVLCHRLKN